MAQDDTEWISQLAAQDAPPPDYDVFERAAQRVRAPYSKPVEGPGIGGGIGQLAEPLVSQPSWLERAAAQSAKDQQAFKMGGVAGLMADTSVGQELAGGFGGTTVGKGIRAWHASPYEFNKFELRPRTGQGANTYGTGIYAAENPALSGKGGSYDREFTASRMGKVDLNQGEERMLQMLRGGASDLDILRDFSKSGGSFDDINAMLERVKQNKAHIYDININADPSRMLDWDRPIGEQVASQLPSHLLQGAKDEAYSRALAATDKRRADQLYDMVKDPSQAPGEFLYKRMAQDTYPIRENPQSRWYASGAASLDEALAKVGGDKSRVQTVRRPLSQDEASQALKDAGIPGIKYLDQGSRHALELQKIIDQSISEARVQRAKRELASLPQTSNYVVFDPKIIDILKKYGLAGTAGAGAMGELARQDKSGENE